MNVGAKRELNVQKQHRCCYTGGKVVLSHLNKSWLCCTNNGEISLLSLKTGEILFNIGVNGEINQRAAPLSKVMTNDIENDEILCFDLSSNDDMIAFATKKHFIKIVELEYVKSDASHSSENESNASRMPSNCKILNSFHCDMGLQGNINVLIFDDSGRMMCLGNGRGEVRIYNVDSCQMTHKYSGHTFPITFLKFDPILTKYKLYSGDSHGNMRAWNLSKDRVVVLNESHKTVQQLQKCNTMTDEVKREARRKRLQMELNKQRAVENVYRKQLMANQHHSAIMNVAFVNTSNANLIISVVMSEDLRVWDADTHEFICCLDAWASFTNIGSFVMSEAHRTSSALASLACNLIFLTDESGCVHICKVCENSSKSRAFRYSLELVEKIEFTRGNHLSNLCFFPSLDNLYFTRMLFQNNSNKSNKTNNKNNIANISQLRFSLIVSSGDYNFYRRDAILSQSDQSGQSGLKIEFSNEQTILGYNDEILDVCQIGSSSNICVATNSNELRIIDIFDGFRSKLVFGHSETIMSVCSHVCSLFSSGLSVIATGSKDACVNVWIDCKSLQSSKKVSNVSESHLSDLKLVLKGLGHDGSVNCVASCGNSKACWFVSGGKDGSVRMWDAELFLRNLSGLKRLKSSETSDLSGLESIEVNEFESCCMLTSHEKEVMDVDVSRNDKFAASVGLDGKLVLYAIDAKNERLGGFAMRGVKEVTYRKGRAIWCVRFSPYERVVATGHGNGEIRVWSIESDNCLECVKVLTGTGGVLKLCFVSGGLQILSTHESGCVRLWNLHNNECLGAYQQHYDRVWAMCKLEVGNVQRVQDAQDALWFVTGGTDSLINVWRDDSGEMEKEKLREKHELTLKKSEISNYIREGLYEQGVKLCLELNQPRRLLSLFKSIMYEKEFASILKRVVSSLNVNEIGQLMSLIVDWNCNGKHCFVSQSLLYVMYNIFDLKEMALNIEPNHLMRRGKNRSKNNSILNLDLRETIDSKRAQSIGEVNSALNAYSNRHLKRVNALIKQTYLIDYVLDSIDAVQRNEPEKQEREMEVEEAKQSNDVEGKLKAKGFRMVAQEDMLD